MGFSLENFFKELKCILSFTHISEKEKLLLIKKSAAEAERYAKECGVV